ncbi:MAG TPA: MFS transporter [Methanomassiliicoccales archaeon]|jgi:MFS family permease
MSDDKKDEKWYYTFLPYNIAGGSTNPIIPLFVTEGLKGTVGQVGIVSAITSLAAVPANILWGNLSDTMQKRKPFVIMGFLGMGLALMLMGLSTSIPQYYLANFMLGLLAAAVAPVGTVLVLESFEKKDWAKRLGDFSKVGGLGWVVGLLIGTVWLMLLNGSDGENSTRALFLLAAVLCLVSTVLAFRWVPEPKDKIRRECIDPDDLEHAHAHIIERARYLPQRVTFVAKVSAKNLKLANFPANLKRYYLVTFLAFFGFLSFYVAFPIFLSQYVGLKDTDIFIIYIASSVASVLTYALVGRLIGSIGGKKIQAVAFALRIFIFPAFFAVTMLNLPFPALFAAMLVLHALAGLCWAGISVSGNALVSKMSYRDFRTQSLGMYSSIQGVASIFGSLLGGFIAQYYGYQTEFLMASGFVLAGLVLLLLTNVDNVPGDDEGPHIIKCD